jgi:hypothetical protein
MRATTRWAGLGVAAMLLLAGCTSEPEHPGDGPVADPAPVDTADEGPDASRPDGSDGADGAVEPDGEPGSGPLAFSARALDGGTVDASVHAGSHTVLWMWAPW